jgi:hypothetical protein
MSKTTDELQAILDMLNQCVDPDVIIGHVRFRLATLLNDEEPISTMPTFSGPDRLRDDVLKRTKLPPLSSIGKQYCDVCGSLMHLSRSELDDVIDAYCQKCEMIKEISINLPEGIWQCI